MSALVLMEWFPAPGLACSEVALAWRYHVALETFRGCLKLHLSQGQAYSPLHALEAIVGSAIVEESCNGVSKGQSRDVECVCVCMRLLTSTYVRECDVLCWVQLCK